MKKMLLYSIMFVLIFALGATAQDGFSESEQKAIDQAMDLLRQKAPDLHITVYPILLNDQAGGKMAAGAALLLENAGVKKIDTIDANFFPSKDLDLAGITHQFQQFVKQNPFTGEYGYFIKITGTQESGGETFTSVMVDKEANIVFADYHTKTFFKPKTVLGCVHEAVKVFCEQADLGDPGNTDGPGGEWQVYFKEEQKKRNK